MKINKICFIILLAGGARGAAAQTAREIPAQAADMPSIVPGKYDLTKRPKVSRAKGPKMLWADSYIWAKAPKLNVEKWLSAEPDLKGKFVLIELWNTWCPHCDTSVPKLNEWHKKYGDELVIIGLCDEPEDVVLNAKNKAKRDFYFAIDTKRHMREALNVRGVPHALLIEPDGHVIWEGFPHLNGHELTEDIIIKALKIGRKTKAKK